MSLNRFISAQKEDFDQAYKEIKNGQKESHWIWYIFPQIIGLGESPTAVYYSLKSINEAKEFMNNDFLFSNLVKITSALYEIQNKTIEEIAGYPDCFKIQSCITLFSHLSSNDIFKKVLDKYYSGSECVFTLEKLKEANL